jgi:hypothetical protein
MTYDAFVQPHEMTHMVGDVPLLFVLAAVLIWLHPRWLRPGATVVGSTLTGQHRDEPTSAAASHP